MSAVAEDLSRVRDRIAAAVTAAGRAEGEVVLVAVSKGKPAEAVRQAYALGQRRFGESYAKELADKAAALADLPGIEWHFIGHLQSNKAKLVVPVAALVHTVDSNGLVAELGRRVASAGRAPLPALVEVNVTREPQKHGISPGDLRDLLDAVEATPGLALRGLMTMAPIADPEAARRCFETLESLRALHGGAPRLPEMSMGMSDDLEIAISAGATLVRVGTAIFGDR